MFLKCFVKFLKTNREFNILLDFINPTFIIILCPKWIILKHEFVFSSINSFLAKTAFSLYFLEFSLGVVPRCFVIFALDLILRFLLMLFLIENARGRLEVIAGTVSNGQNIPTNGQNADNATLNSSQII